MRTAGTSPYPRDITRLKGLNSVLVLVGITAVGALAAGLAGGGPGLILELSLLVGTVAAALAIEARLSWLVIPAPPLVYVVMAPAAGLIGKAGAAKSATALSVNVGTWIGHGFIAMMVSTLLAIAIAAVRITMLRRADDLY